MPRTRAEKERLKLGYVPKDRYTSRFGLCLVSMDALVHYHPAQDVGNFVYWHQEASGDPRAHPSWFGVQDYETWLDLGKPSTYTDPQKGETHV